MLSQLAALAFCIVIGLLGVFQLALACGAPWGRLAWGGGQARLPARLRVASLVSIVIYGLFALIILERAGQVALLPSPDISRIGAWVIAGYMALGVIVNAISRSPPERLVMTPVAFLLAGSSAIVAMVL